jgi:hypothetical protein
MVDEAFILPTAQHFASRAEHLRFTPPGAVRGPANGPLPPWIVSATHVSLSGARSNSRLCAECA